MFVAQSWLTEALEQSNPEWSVSTQELDDGFVNVGFEIEGVPQSLPSIAGPLRIGRVLSIEKLEGFKKPIRFCMVDVNNDDGQPQEIVCGAQNFSEGDLVVVALPGVILPGDFEILPRKTYGKYSMGMMCSASELGLGSDHSGILVLPEGTAKPGDSAHDILQLDDTVFEVNITPDRGYALSVRGLTRELAASFELAYVDPAVELPLGSGPIQLPVVVEENTHTTRFAMREVTGVDLSKRSPWWLQRRLLLSGLRPINVAVDVGNYVMLEIGQPMHAFDRNKLSGGLTVRRAQQGEEIITLDGVKRTLSSEDVVIADGNGPVSIAGVMGGESTQVDASTTDVLFEAACFEPLAVFRTGRRHKLSSESSRRFERSVDPAIARAALDRAATLLQQIAGGSVVDALIDIGTIPEMAPIVFDSEEPSKVAGTTYPEGTTELRLTEVGCTVEVIVDAGEEKSPESGGDKRPGSTGDKTSEYGVVKNSESSAEGTRQRGFRKEFPGSVLKVTPPTWRPDLKESADLVEEVLRLEGLEKIPSVPPRAPLGRGFTLQQRKRRSISRGLASAGYIEVLPTPFIADDTFDVWGLAPDDPRRIETKMLNPLDSSSATLATTLLPALFEVVKRNVNRGQHDLSLYGVAQVCLPKKDAPQTISLPVDHRPTEEELVKLQQSLPDQPLHVAAVLTGLRLPAGPWGQGRVADVFDAIEAARVVARADSSTISFTNVEHLPFHPGRCAEISSDGRIVGYAGEIHPAVVERVGLPAHTCAMEISIDALSQDVVLPAPAIYPYPPVLQDIALVVDEDVPSADVEAALRRGAGSLLEEVSLFDVFRGEQLGQGKKSLAFGLRFRADNRTLTEDEATEQRNSAVAEAGSAVNAVMRS